jgi:N utilization substance protein A
MATMAAVPSTENSLGSILDQVAKEKGIDKKILVETIEAAILKAAQSVFGPTRELEARFSEDTGQVDLFQYMTVVEVVAEPEREISVDAVEKHKLDATLGEELGFQVFWRPEDADKAREQDREFGDILKLKAGRTTFGRIAAQTAKQVLLQRVRDAERDLIFNEYKDRKGSSGASSAASRRATTSSSTSARRRACCPSASRRRARRTARATASSPT